LTNILKKQGLPAAKDALIEIAEGKRKAEEVYGKLFTSKKEDSEYHEQKNMYRLKYSIHQENPSIFQKLDLISEFGEIQWKTLHVFKGNNIMKVSFVMKATNAGISLFDRALIQAGAKNLERQPISRYGNFLIGLIILLWALNPVIAKKILLHGISPLTLFSVRMLTFCFCTTLFYAGWRWSTGNRFKRIPHLTRLALLPSIVTAALAIYTYEALIFLPPSIHLTIIRCNALLIPSLFFIKKRFSFVMSASVCLLFSVGILLLIISPVSYVSLSIASSILAVMMYSSYSVITEDILHKYKIGLRYPALMFRLGFILGLFGLFLVPIVPWSTIAQSTVLFMILYTILCVFVPYALFTTLLNTRQIQHLNDLFFIEPPIAIIAEIFILGIVLPLWIYPVVLIGLFGIYSLRNWRNLRSKMLHH
jgi:drug/metabolite transporter (DMT)-like permease